MKTDKSKSEQSKPEKLKLNQKSKFEPDLDQNSDKNNQNCKIFEDSDDSSPSAKKVRREHTRVFISSDSEDELISENRNKQSTQMQAQPSINSNANKSTEKPNIPSKSVPKKGAKKKNNKNSGPSLTEISNKIRKVINAVIANDNSWPFRDPVTEEIAPQYFDVVKEPMDLRKMTKKNNTRQYKSIGAFVYDFELMIENCRKYNGEDEIFTPLGDKLTLFFKDKIRQLKLKE